jgi:heme-degrading monooxygenase HmoA
MILEAALLTVKPGQAAEFEAAITKARPLIEASEGFQGIEVRPCLEDPNRYLLLVRWARLEDHTEGFHGSERYQDWKAALHHFYEPFPTVAHYGPPL